MNNEVFLTTMSINPQAGQLIDRLIIENAEELNGLEEPLKNACILKHRDLIIESLVENERKGNFVRIYPGKNSSMYD